SSPGRWVPGFGRPDPSADALAALVLAYLASYGPATTEQAALWLGVPATAMRRVVASLLDRLVEVDLAGAPAYLPAHLAGEAAEPGGDEAAGGVHLLPYFDPYVVGCHPRSLLFPGDAATRALTRGQAGTRAV